MKDEYVLGSLTPVGFQLIEGATDLISLAPPATARLATIHVAGGNVRYRDDGPAPTDSVGIQVEDGERFDYQGDLSALKMMPESDPVDVSVSYYT